MNGKKHRINPLKRMGSKAKLAGWIVANLPQHEQYVEVFGGSGAVLFAKKRASGHEVYNDLDGLYHNTMRVIRDLGSDLAAALWMTRIAVQAEEHTDTAPQTEGDILVTCTYAAPGRIGTPADEKSPSRRGRPAVLPQVLEYASRCLERGCYDIILLDNTLRGLGGDQRDYGVDVLLPIARQGSPDAMIAIITGFRMIADERTDAIRRAFTGPARADMWLPKLSESLCDTLCSIILLVASKKQLQLQNVELHRENRQLRAQHAEMEDELRIRLHYDTCEEIVSRSAVFKKAAQEAMKIARAKRSVLITGESGTGKELIQARYFGQGND